MKSLKEEKLYIRVVEEIKKEIMEGTLKKGEKLPPEREIAETLEVSRASVREAMRALEVSGLIVSKHGSGNFIRDDFNKSLIEPLSLIFLLNGSNKKEIHEIRSSLEAQAVLVASEKLSDSDLNKLESIVDQLSKSHDEELNNKLDREFHYTIINATDNTFIQIFLSTLTSVMEKFIKEAREEILLYNNKEKLNLVHYEIVEALKEKNKNKLIEAMKKHADMVYESINE